MVRPADSATLWTGWAGRASAAIPSFLLLLAAAGLADWLVTRTLTRLAIFIPKTPAMIAGYQALSWAGQVGSALAALLALASVAWLVRAEWRSGLGALLAGLGILSLLFLVQPPGNLLLLYHLLLQAALLALIWRALRLAGPASVRLAGLLPALALIAAGLHQVGPAIYAALRWPGPAAWGSPLFHAGEALVVASAVALWWAYGRQATRRAWLAAALPALLFAAAYLAAPAMTATLVVWSNGLTLFLPWPAYALALWLAGVTVLASWQRNRPAATAVLLLAAAGYAPQLSSQVFFALTALWLLARQPLVAEGVDALER